MWNLKKNDTNELIDKKEIEYKLMVTKGERGKIQIWNTGLTDIHYYI